MFSCEGPEGEIMVFRRRKTNGRAQRSKPDDDAHEDAIRNRLRSIGESGGYSYSPDERDDVEARIRRMWYGAKKEGSKAETPDDDS